MTSRSQRAQIAQESLEILKQGFYQIEDNLIVSLEKELTFAKENSRVFHPEDFETLLVDNKNKLAEKEEIETEITVINRTTLATAKELWEGGETQIFILNFASAKNPGGGFLNGSQAQEESLARASGLYPCLLEHKEMYDFNKGFGSSLYSDYMIYAPQVPVFRDDKDELLSEVYSVSFLTAPAVNAGAVRDNEKNNVPKIPDKMRNRTEKVLTIASMLDYEVLVLGAWGCGVFRNEPQEVAEHFHSFLKEGGAFHNVFRKVVFAVLDNTKNQLNIQAFESVFNKL